MNQNHELVYGTSTSCRVTLTAICKQDNPTEVIMTSLTLYEKAQEAYDKDRPIISELGNVRKTIAPDDFLIRTLDFILLRDSTKESAFSKEMDRKRSYSHELEIEFSDRSYNRLDRMVQIDGNESSAIVLKKALSFYQYAVAIYAEGGKLFIENDKEELKEVFEAEDDEDDVQQ